MNTTDLVRIASIDSLQLAPADQPPTVQSVPAFSSHALATPLRHAILHARQHLLHLQQEDGSWKGVQHGDASQASQLIFLQVYLGREQDEILEQAAESIFEQQLPQGGWPCEPGGPADRNVSVQAYLALKLAGYEPSDPRLSRARDVIRQLGGADGSDANTRYFLALFGQIDYDCCPVAVPRLSQAEEASSTRSIIWSHRPVFQVGLSRGVRELFLERPECWPACSAHRPLSLRKISESISRQCERWGFTPGRHRALDRAESLLAAQLTEQEHGPCNFRMLVWQRIALHTLGYDAENTALQMAEAQLTEMVLVDSERGLAEPQPGRSPAIDTALATQALKDSYAPGNALPPDLKVTGDLVPESNAKKDFHQPPVGIDPMATDRDIALLRRAQRADGSWDSETGIRFIHGTSLAVRRLVAAGCSPEDRAVEAGVHWLLVHQQPTGGWGETASLEDYTSGPATATQTAWALLALIAVGSTDCEAVRQGIRFLLETQEEEGFWDEPQFTLRDTKGQPMYRNELHATCYPLMALSRWAIATEQQMEQQGHEGLKLFDMSGRQ